MKLLLQKFFRIVSLFSLFLFALACARPASATIYSVAIPAGDKPIVRGHLDLGGNNPQGDEITVNSYYLELNGVPFFPIVGELHYSRVPDRDWEQEIAKMKAGGINVIATYVFWNLHERKQGFFDWEGNLNLRHFLELCEKNDIFAIVRMGPFCHGEMRNGGLPDWLYGRAFEVRSNDPEYLAYVDVLYGEIANQMRGLLYKDGGPVIGVQLENEFQHSAAPWEWTYPGAEREMTVAEKDAAVTHVGVSVSEVENTHAEEGKKHMAILKETAKHHGVEVPIYTATGWGNAAIVDKGSLPVTAGYAYPFWAKPEPSPFYRYKDIHRNPDYMPVSFETDLYPSIPAELGPGIVATWKRRPLVDPDSVAPLIVRTIGSGSNGIGYYMYHGGSTPVYDGHFYNEASGGVPKINYDFQAPIGEYGQIRSHHRSLNILHLFIEHFGDRLAPMKTTVPAGQESIDPEDVDTLRYAVRSFGKSAFVFMHNYQDHVEPLDLKDLKLKIGSDGEQVELPYLGSLDLNAGVSAILPIHLMCEAIDLRSATVQPLAILHPQGQPRTLYVFSALPGMSVEFVFEGRLDVEMDVADADCWDLQKEENVTVAVLHSGTQDEVHAFSIGDVEFVVLPYAMAKTAWKDGKGHLLFSSAALLAKDGYLQLLSEKTPLFSVDVLPRLQHEPISSPSVTVQPVASIHPLFSRFQATIAGEVADVDIEQVSARKFKVQPVQKLDAVHDLLLSIPYVGDRGLAFIDGTLVADHFYYGRPWEISLKRFESNLTKDPMILVFHPMLERYEYMIDLEYSKLKPDFAGRDRFLEIGKPELIPVFKGVIAW